ncbi:uncharacterized protein LOC144104581 [Amblyomma americanum]|uniref:Uncharacterized protein n=1 Tax=Amblyomma americanum TaxID=6943 RepID=A0AAQ4EE40_AMBAM
MGDSLPSFERAEQSKTTLPGGCSSHFDGNTPKEPEPACYPPVTALMGNEDKEEGDSASQPQPSAAEEAEQFSLDSAQGIGDTPVDPAAVEQYLLEEYYGPLVTSSGTVSMFLKKRVRVDISVDRAVRVVNFSKHCMAALSRLGDRICICHPCGRVLQEGPTINIETGMRLAKMSRRGVTFTALHGHHLRGLVYLVDNSGTKSTTEMFKEQSYDVALKVFRSESDQGIQTINKCFEIVAQVTQEPTEDGEDVWLIGGVCIVQKSSGDVEVSPDFGRNIIFSSPAEGAISITTPVSKMAVSYCPDKFLFVRMGRKRVCVSAEKFVVRNGGQKAGLDSRGRLTLR